MLKGSLIKVGFMVLAMLTGLAFMTVGCETGFEATTVPGILRVTFQSDPEDISIIIVSDTLVVTQKDSFVVTIFQGRVYADSNFALLFKDTTSFRTEDFTYNILEVNPSTGEYRQVVIYESYVPPINYTSIQFGLTASRLKIGNFEVPVKLAAGASPVIDLDYDFTVFENKVTEVNVRIAPFESVTRFRDTFHLTPKINVIRVNYF